MRINTLITAGFLWLATILPSAGKETPLPSAIPGGAVFIKQYPKSDTNGDDILTLREKEEFCVAHTIDKLGGNYTFRKEMVPMRDGVNLATAIFIPPGKGPFPAVITRTAYGIWSAAFFDTASFANQGLVFICQDLRGDGESEGAGTVDLKSFDNEMNDGYDTIEWITKQQWSNGHVGISGQSGHGFSAYMAYLAKHPNLTAAYTNISGGNAHLYWTFHNGVRREMYGWLSQRNVKIQQWPRPTIELFDKKIYAQTVKTATQNNQTVFIARTGWYDIFAESALDYFQSFAENGRVFLRVDALGHGRMGGKKFPPREIPAVWRLPNFVDVLKNPDGGGHNKSQMLYYLMGDCSDKNAPGNRYKVTSVWPVPHTPTSYYMKEDGSLDTKKPLTTKASLSFKYDPNNPVPSVGGDVFIHKGVGPLDQRALKNRKDILRFSTEPLKEPLEITGKVMAELYVSTDVKDTTFTAKLIDVYPDGYEAIVRDSIIMGRFHKGFDQEHSLKKGAVYKLTLDMWSTALVINKGHKIAVHISSSNSPKYEVHPNTFKPVNSFKKVPVAYNTLQLSSEYPSNIILPVVLQK